MKKIIDMTLSELEERHKRTRAGSVFFLLFFILLAVVSVFLMGVPSSMLLVAAVLAICFNTWAAVEKVLLYIKKIRKDVEARQRRNERRRAARAKKKRSKK